MDLVGGVDSRDGYVSKILYVKMKESGPLGGGVRRASANVDPPMTRHVRRKSIYNYLGYIHECEPCESNLVNVTTNFAAVTSKKATFF